MWTRRVSTLAVLATVVASAVGIAAALEPRQAASHEDAASEANDEAYWLPRHRALLAQRRSSYPVATLPPHQPARLKFKRSKRISGDILGAPPADMPDAQGETQTEPYVAVNPADPNHLLAGWQETRFTDWAARAMGVAVSTDGGRKWVDALLPGVAVAAGGESDRASDPWPAFGPDGVAYYSSLLVSDELLEPNSVTVSVSRDGGFSWDAPVEVFRDGHLHDKNSMVADTMDGSPHRGNVYVGWNTIALGPPFFSKRTLVSRSTDEGRSWIEPVILVEGGRNIGIVMRIGPNGTVYAVWAGANRGAANLSIMFTKSTNGGRSFRKVKEIADMLPVGTAGFRSGAILPSFDIDPATGDMFVVWPDARFSGTDQAALIVSRDGGASWTPPARVNDGPTDVSTMTVGVAANAAGQIVVGYYTRRNATSKTTTIDYYVNRSRDGGRSFEDGVRVTRKSFDASVAALSVGDDDSSIFLGDYVGLAGGRRRFYAVFTAAFKKSKLTAGRQPDIFGAASR